MTSFSNPIQTDDSPAVNPMKLLLITGLAVFLVFLDATVLYVAFEDMRADFSNYDLSAISWILNGYTIALSSLLLPLGLYGNYFGLKRSYLLGVVIFGVASVLCSLSSNITWLIAGRVLQGVGAAIVIPTSLTLVLNAFPMAKRPIAISLWGALAALSAAIGPTLGSLLVEAGGWRWVFWINVPVALVTLFGTVKNAREAVFQKYGLPDTLSSLLVIAGSLFVTFGLTSIEQSITQDQWVTMGIGLVLLCLFLVRNQMTKTPLIQKSFLTNSTINLANIGSVIFSIAFAIMFFGTILFLMNVWDYSFFYAGIAVTPGPFTVIPVAIFTGKILRSKGHFAVSLVGSFCYLCGSLYAFFLWNSEVNYLLYCLPSLVLTGLGVGILIPTLSTLAIDRVDPVDLAQGVSLNQTARQFGTVLGVAIMVVFFNQHAASNGLLPYQYIFATMGLCAVLTFVCLAWVAVLKRASKTPEVLVVK